MAVAVPVLGFGLLVTDWVGGTGAGGTGAVVPGRWFTGAVVPT